MLHILCTAHYTLFRIWSKSIFGVVDAPGGDSERGLILWHIRAVVDFGDSCLAPALPQRDPSGGGMRQDIAPNRFFRVGLKILSFSNDKTYRSLDGETQNFYSA